MIEVEFVTGWEAENPETLTDLKEVQRVETDREENKVIKKILVFLLRSNDLFRLCYILMR